MKPTHQELLTAKRECDIEDGVKFSVLEAWLKKQVMKGRSATRNPLLVNSVVGKTSASSYDLLGKNHVYGVKIARDKEHGADGQCSTLLLISMLEQSKLQFNENGHALPPHLLVPLKLTRVLFAVIFHWHKSKSKSNDNADMYVDRVKMNINAVKSGHTTAKEFVMHGQRKKQYTSLKKKTRQRNSTKGEPLEVDSLKTFGQLRTPQQPAIKGLIQSDYNISVMEPDTAYVRSSGTQKTKREQRAVRAQLKTTKMTKAQRLRDGSIRDQINPRADKQFKMKQFSNVPSRLGATGARILNSS